MNLSKKDPTIHPEQIREVISTPPKWLYNWGITILLSIAVICVLIASVIKYPESVSVRIKLIGSEMPEEITAKKTGKLMRLFIKDNQHVSINDPLAEVKIDTGLITLRSPIKGRARYAEILHKNLFIEQGQPLFTIQNSDTDYYGEILLTEHREDQFKVGQQVLVKIDRLAKQDGVLLKGTIKNLLNGKFSKRGYAIAEVQFDSSNQFPAYQGGNFMTDAEIVTNSSTLLKKFLKSLTGRKS